MKSIKMFDAEIHVDRHAIELINFINSLINFIVSGN